jgi:hypothetical protein
MHWPYPANPAEYQAPGLGLVLGLGCAIVVIFVVAVFYGAQSNAALLCKPEPELDEAGPEIKSNQ